MGTEPGDVAADAAALKAKLDALVKDAEEAEEKAVAARRRARAARTLLEEEQAAATLEKVAVAARQLVPGSSSGTNHTSPSSYSYEETVVAGLHLQPVAILNVLSFGGIEMIASSMEPPLGCPLPWPWLRRKLGLGA
jgi:beta-glucosidase-like glycosyl hydrolase